MKMSRVRLLSPAPQRNRRSGTCSTPFAHLGDGPNWGLGPRLVPDLLSGIPQILVDQVLLGDVFTFNSSLGLEVVTTAGEALEHLSITGPHVRCDRIGYVNNRSMGCIMERHTPAFKLRLTGPTPQSADHILDAITEKGKDAYLVRLRGYFNKSRRVARSLCAAKSAPVVGKDCDEYPFASTAQGCYFDKKCSTRRILSADNQASGSELGQFYAKRRIISGDTFRVRILP